MTSQSCRTDWGDFFFWLTIFLWGVGLPLFLIVSGCAKPKIDDILGKGVNCKANITMPEGWKYEEVEVKVKIFDCTEATHDGTATGN